jgi:nucleoside-diphosphate-sugar epimerase
MRIAVTGGSGRIGSAVVKEFVERGHDVINIDRRQAEQPIARFIFADLAERQQVQSILEQVEAVCHLGEIPNVHASMSPEEILALNVRVGATVMQTAADLKLSRAIYTSSCQAYGLWEPPLLTRPQRLPFDETHPLAPHNAYALSKATNETFSRMVSDRHGLSVAIFRFPWVPVGDYSPSWEATLRELPTQTDGFATYCHISDIARAYALAIERPRVGCEVYHFSGAEIMSLIPLAQRLREHHPDFPPLPANWPAFKSPMLLDKAREHFGWEPKWNLLDFYRQRHGEIEAAA